MSSDDKSNKKGLKLNNNTSSVQQPKPNTAALFDEKAKQVISQYEDFKQRTWDLSTKLKSMVEDRTLQENKSILSKDLENEILNKLIVLASEMNEDDNQPEGIGSTALCMLIMKMMLLQRDTINMLSFKLDKLEKINSKLEILLSDKK